MACQRVPNVNAPYAFDDIGNRATKAEAGRATISAATPPTLSPTDPTRDTVYTAGNGLNQYTGIDSPQFFNVRGTRSNTMATIVVNGDMVDNSPTADSGYQQHNTTYYFRDEAPNTTPGVTSSPDLYEPVTVTQNGSPLTVDNPLQYIPPEDIDFATTPRLDYDADGNLLSDGRWTYVWDAADRLVSMTAAHFVQDGVTLLQARKISFEYDGLSRRVRKKVEQAASTAGPWTPVNHEAYVYEGWNMVMSVKLQNSGSAAGLPESRLATWVWGPDIGSRLHGRAGWQRAGGTGGLIMALFPTDSAKIINTLVPVMDHTGNVVRVGLILGYSGSSTGLYWALGFDYDVFGREMRASKTASTTITPAQFPFRFSTKFTDAETGLVYYGYRYYDPAWGRWINRDPIGEEGGLNLYGIVENDPTNKTDTLGLCATSMEEVLQVACEKYGPKSSKEDVEYGGVIIKCKKDGKDCYEGFTSVKGDHRSVEVEDIKNSANRCESTKDCEVVASWHTHPRAEYNNEDPTTKYNNNINNQQGDVFSMTDIDYNANKNGKNLFGKPMKGGLCGANGSVRVHNPSRGCDFKSEPPDSTFC